MINLEPKLVLCQLIWWGEKRIVLLSEVTLSSTVKKLEFSELPSKSGMPEFIAFSILFQRVSLVFDLTSCQSFCSGFTWKPYTIFYDNIKIENACLLTSLF